jgi:hypothetical protein
VTRYWHTRGWQLSEGGSWQDHIDRGSPGGEDFPLGYGTPVYAPDDGMLSFHRASERPNRIYGAAGWDGAGQVLLLTRPDRVEITLFHASAGQGLTLGGPARQVTKSALAGKSGGADGTPSKGLSSGPHAHEHAVVKGRRVPISSLMSGGGLAGGNLTPIAPTRRLAMTARYIVAPGPLWAGIDLVAFRSQGGVVVTTEEATAENLSRMYPFDAENVTRDELNKSVIAARLWVAQVVDASFGGAAVVDAASLAAELAPLLRVADSDLTEAEFLAYLEAGVAEMQASIAAVPAAAGQAARDAIVK